MKTTMSFQLAPRSVILFFAAVGLAVAEFHAPAADQPAITSIRMDGTNVAVTARVPSGIRRVTLECRDRLGRGAWEPRAVARLDGSGGLVSFRLPRSRQLELMRVRADATDPLPASFYTGTNSFYEQASGAPGGGVVTTMGGVLVFDLARESAPEREVVESDIWKIRGQTLYFFNQLRGLQVIDISNPDAAVVRSTIELPAAGEDMYLLGSNHMVLLAGNACGASDSEVIIVSDSNGVASITARLPVAGSIQESRLVGKALYVASQSYRLVAGTTGDWEWGTIVSSFDLRNANAPVARGTLWYPGYGNVVTATDRLLFVVTQHPDNWWRSTIRSIDITAANGTMHAYKSINVAGQILDKFKLNWEGGVLTSISEDWRPTPPRTVTTKLETFRLPDPLSLNPLGVSKLGELELGRGERLHATRFDGDRVYVVTFFQIDPLWVVDLSNASSPRIAGSVDVPGWSTFIQPLGDRLVTIGVETNRVAVSLFNVANPAAPTLLSRVKLGENYSWSEANSDEKAFSVLPEAGLILVPYSGDTTNGYASRVQLIDLKATSLVARGLIEHQFQPRRATLYENRILSISGSELLSVDATDRDHPVVRGDLALAWPVDRVFVEGNFVVEIGGVLSWGWWGNEGQPVVRVARANSPNDLLTELSLTNLPVLGATTRGGRLYIAQGQQNYWFGPIFFDVGDTNGFVAPRPKLLLTVIDLTHLPALSVLGQTEAETDLSTWGGDLQPVWPRPDVLVWVGGGFNYWWIQPFARISLVADVAFSRWWFPWWGGSGGGQLIAFDVSNPAAPAFASEVNLSAGDRWSFSKAFAAEGLVYLSHQTSEFVPAVGSSSTATNTSSPGTDGGVVPEPIGTWLSRSYLDVVDYAYPQEPFVRKPVNIPGTLNGISHQGAVLYTVGTHWTTNISTAWTEYLDASGYDGVSAHLIDSLALPPTWPHPLLVAQTNIFIGRGGVVGGTAGTVSISNTPPALETWYLANTGRLTRAGTTTLSGGAAHTLMNFDALLAVQQTDNTTTLFDASNGAALRRIGGGSPNGCFGFDLTHADGELGRGLWVPLGAYGVSLIPVDP